jgi:hypothetical protein
MMQTATTISKIEKKMQKLVDSFNIPLRVVWCPDPKAKCHGEIANSCIEIYDVDKEEAWNTFTHEMLEYTLKKVTNIYLETVNALIEVIQKIAYKEKESFIESIPALIDSIQKAKSSYDETEEETNSSAAQ